MIDNMKNVEEAVKLARRTTCNDLLFVAGMARFYNCKPLNMERDDFLLFLSTLYHYGKVQGIRHERIKRRKNI